MSADTPSRPPPDQAARRAALDPTRSFIVKAPAGSGKTTLLTQRFLRLLAGTEHPESILAITFTRKATAEMRDKVVDALTRARSGAPGKNAADEETLRLAAVVLGLDAKRGWQLASQPTRLRIQTIDSLNHWLAGRLPILSRAGASLAIASNADELYKRAARLTIAELESGGALAEDLAVVLEHLDNEVDRLEPLLATMLASRERWLRHVVAAAGGRVDDGVRAALEECLAALVGESLARAARELPAAACAQAWRLLAGALKRLDAEDAAARLVREHGAQGLAPHAGHLIGWQLFAERLLTKDGEFRKTVNKNHGFPPEAKADKLAFLAVLDEFREIEGLDRVVAAVVALPPAAYDDAQWRVLRALHAVLVMAAARLQQVFAAEAAVDFSAVQSSALEALGSPEEPTDLTLELDYRVQHVLIDEFQDTSTGQIALLERLTAGWQAGDGRTLFVVGDPMQSIYAFREADVALFLQVRKHGLGGVVLEPLTLIANFRSRPAIVDWVNDTFALVLPRAEDLTRGAVPYSTSAAVRDAEASSRVEPRILAGGTTADEAAEVADIIALERARNPTVKIAVLGQSRGPLSAVARELRTRGVAFQGVDLVPLAERPAVRDLVSLSRAIAHLADRIAWLACLRAPWCGLGLDSLWQLCADSPDATLWDLMNEPERVARLAPSEAARLKSTRAVLGTALADRGRRPLAATVEAAWLALGGPATLSDAADLDNADSFLARLDSLEQAGDLEDPAALALSLEKLYAAPEAGADETLQLLTVHRAKGLEWPVVVLVGLGRRTRGAEDKLLHWLEYTRAPRRPGLVLAPRRAGAQRRDALEAWLKGIEKERASLELGRLLYVATTRAMERLYLVGHVRPLNEETGKGGVPEGGSLLAKLWPAIGAGLVPRPPRSTPAAAEGARLPPQRLADGWTAPAPAPAVVALLDAPRPAGPSEFEFEWVTAAARHVGTVVHEELERAGARALAVFAAGLASRAPVWRRRLLELGVTDDELGRSLERVRRALEGTLTDARGRWLFDASHTDVASELEISSLRGGQVVALRIDRSFVASDGVRWIVDFKTSVHEGTDLAGFLDREQARYALQLEAYAELLARRDGAHPIRLGLYFPLLGGWREWAAGSAPGA